jgi:hypothetical protein
MVNSKLIDTVVEAYLAANPKANAKALRPAVETIMHAIQHVNTMDEYAVKYSDLELLSQIKIPNELKDFVLPAEVRRDANNVGSKKLLIHDEDCSNFPSVSEITNAIATVRMSQRKGVNDELVEITSLRGVVNLADIWDRVAKIDENNEAKSVLSVRKTDKGEDKVDPTGVKLKGHSDGKVVLPIIVDRIALETEEDWYLNSDYVTYDAIITNFISSKVSGLN